VETGKNAKAVLRTVRGTLYTDGEPTTYFEADGARVDQEAQLLILKGNVKVRSLGTKVDENKVGRIIRGEEQATDLEGTLTCDTVRYEAKDPNRKILKAQGNVKVVGKAGTIGPTPELWANSKLTVVATPNLFDTK
jgi:lipopolysaccharide assembly outer membrane protein LptD (OstA)